MIVVDAEKGERLGGRDLLVALDLTGARGGVGRERWDARAAMGMRGMMYCINVSRK